MRNQRNALKRKKKKNLFWFLKKKAILNLYISETVHYGGDNRYELDDLTGKNVSKGCTEP